MRFDETSLIEAVAFDMVKSTYPQHIQESYERHMTVEYSAAPYVYVLQELAGILTGIGIGVLSNMIYAKFQSSQTISKKDMLELLFKYKTTVEELKETVKAHKEELEKENRDSRIRELSQECLDEISYHEEMALQLQEKDPETIFSVNEALVELKKRNETK